MTSQWSYARAYPTDKLLQFVRVQEDNRPGSSHRKTILATGHREHFRGGYVVRPQQGKLQLAWSFVGLFWQSCPDEARNPHYRWVWWQSLLRLQSKEQGGYLQQASSSRRPRGGFVLLRQLAVWAVTHQQRRQTRPGLVALLVLCCPSYPVQPCEELEVPECCQVGASHRTDVLGIIW